MTQNTNIVFTLVGITTKQFAIIEDNFQKEGNVRFGMSFNFNMNPDNKVIGVFPTFQLECNESVFLIIETACHFNIKDEAWNQMCHEEDKKLVLPKGFVQHLGMLAVGTARGVLHAKTENTEFNNFFIPPINVTNFLKEDIVFELKNEQEPS